MNRTYFKKFLIISLMRNVSISNRITCKQIDIYQMCYVIMSDETIDQNQNADMNKK